MFNVNLCCRDDRRRIFTIIISLLPGLLSANVLCFCLCNLSERVPTTRQCPVSTTPFSCFAEPAHLTHLHVSTANPHPTAPTKILDEGFVFTSFGCNQRRATQPTRFCSSRAKPPSNSDKRVCPPRHQLRQTLALSRETSAHSTLYPFKPICSQVLQDALLPQQCVVLWGQRALQLHERHALPLLLRVRSPADLLSVQRVLHGVLLRGQGVLLYRRGRAAETGDGALIGHARTPL